MPRCRKYITTAGIILIKYWLEVSNKEQERRFRPASRIRCASGSSARWTCRHARRWYDYSRARDQMLEATDTKHAPWHIVRSDDKKRARLNCIAHLL